MTDAPVELYTDADIAGLRRRIKTWTCGLFLFSLLALGVCIALAALTTTGNAQRMELAAIAVSTVSGWIVLYCAIFTVGAARRELGHAGTLREGERQRVEGRVQVTRRWLRIKKSITALAVDVETAEGTKSFWVSRSRAKRLASARPSALWICHGYVAAYEVTK